MKSESDIPHIFNLRVTSEAPLPLDFGTSELLRKPSTKNPISTRTGVSPILSWKAVGGPATSSGALCNSSSENPNFGLFRKTSTSNLGNNIGNELDDDLRSSSTPSSTKSSTISAGGNWDRSGLSWDNQNIWSEQNISRTSFQNPSVYKAENFSDILPITGGFTPNYRQQRSFSIAYGQHGLDFLEDLDDKERHRQTLEALGEELTDQEYESISKLRFRSKSSFGTYHFPSINNVVPVPPGFENESSNITPSLHSLWGQQLIGSEISSVSRRRSIANPTSFGHMWDRKIGADPATIGTDPFMQAFNTERLESLNQHRRYSLAPSPLFPEIQFSDPSHEVQMNNRANSESDYNTNSKRHSVAISDSYSNKQQTDSVLLEAFKSIEIDDSICTESVSNLTKHPEESTAKENQHQCSYSDLEKEVSISTPPSQGLLYIVEFKAGRTDIFYTTENSGLVCRKGDLVIVEADRGKDLGKIINDSVTPKQLELLQQHQTEENVPGDSRSSNKPIQPKIIYRLAQPSEIALLTAKNQDEAKAMLVCQNKVRQKKLPMEVMDAEYQWDRRKLTFYFIAQRRIDFRELVRDLFKIYKTRIWMCAVNTNPITTLLSAADTQSDDSTSSTDTNE